jgi:hypothetical protein
MIFALSILFVFVALYFLVHESPSSYKKHINFNDIKSAKDNSHTCSPISTIIDFDIEALLMPNELNITIVKEKKV